MAQGAKKDMLTHPEFPGVEVAAVPAPWDLEGRGYMLLYRPKKADRARLGHGSEGSRGLSAVMLVDYARSNAGPYRELLYIPGKVPTPHGDWHRISRIYVSTMDSVINGRHNWAIPKNHAGFDFDRKSANQEEVTVSSNGKTLFRAVLKARGPAFPVSTKLLPFPLLQPAENGTGYLQTTFTGTGKGRFAALEELQVDKEAFPDLAGIKPLGVIAVEPFRIRFPLAGVVSG